MRIVAWDPETASEAEIEEMIGELDKITAGSRQGNGRLRKEKAEADAIKKNYDRYMSAAEILHKQVDEAKDRGR